MCVFALAWKLNQTGRRQRKEGRREGEIKGKERGVNRKETEGGEGRVVWLDLWKEDRRRDRGRMEGE